MYPDDNLRDVGLKFSCVSVSVFNTNELYLHFALAYVSAM